MWDLKQNTDELIYRTETHSQTWKTNVRLRKGTDIFGQPSMFEKENENTVA